MHKERIAKFVSNQNITIVDAMEKTQKVFCS